MDMGYPALITEPSGAPNDSKKTKALDPEEMQKSQTDPNYSESCHDQAASSL